MKRNSIFRDELPGEKKSIINLLMTGYIVVISCLGYATFFLYVQLGQVERIVGTMDTQTLTPDQIELLKNRIIRSAVQLKNETIGMALVGTLVCIIGGFYTVSMIIKPLRTGTVCGGAGNYRASRNQIQYRNQTVSNRDRSIDRKSKTNPPLGKRTAPKKTS